MPTQRILTGIRPTGPLHLGHKVGALDNWITLQNSGSYECFFLIADTQALTTHSENPELIKSSVKEVVLDWLACGLNPNLPQVNFVLQSAILERYELSILLQMVTPWTWVEANPTIKSEMASLKDEMVVGFPSYPVDQAADILMVAQTPAVETEKLLVPVGEDQLPHIELTRRIARRFNSLFGKDILPECQALVGKVGRLVGTDGNEKMSKSKNNALFLSDDENTIKRKVNNMYTDPNKIHASDPGNVSEHVPFKYLEIFYSDQEEIEQLKKDYEKGRIGDVPVKQLLIKTLEGILSPIRERRKEFEISTNIKDILYPGTKRARLLASQVTHEVRNAMHLYNFDS